MSRDENYRGASYHSKPHFVEFFEIEEIAVDGTPHKIEMIKAGAISSRVSAANKVEYKDEYEKFLAGKKKPKVSKEEKAEGKEI